MLMRRRFNARVYEKTLTVAVVNFVINSIFAGLFLLHGHTSDLQQIYGILTSRLACLRDWIVDLGLAVRRHVHGHTRP